MLDPSSLRLAAFREWATHTVAGRVAVAGVAIKLAVLLVRGVVGSPPLVTALDTAGSLALLGVALVVGARLFARARRVVLWRVRRKLTLSYIFIAVVPALLIVTFFLVCGLLLFYNIGSYLMRTRLQALADELHFIAESTALELEGSPGGGAAGEVLARRQAGASTRYPNISFAVVPADRACGAARPSPGGGRPPDPTPAGPWAHVDPPASLPAWVPCEGHGSLFAYYAGAEGPTRLAVRAAALPQERPARFALVIDVPIGHDVERRLFAEAGVEMGLLVPIEQGPGVAQPVEGRPTPNDSASPPGAADRLRIMAGPAQVALGDDVQASQLEWATLIDYRDWTTGATGTLGVTFRMSPLEAYRRISETSLTRVSNLSFGQILLLLLAVVGALFLVIQTVAFGMGLTLARSITGAVHELFEGTERVRRGDFTHKITVHSRDQLGELAESFNSMTASIEDLLRQKAEKERLEQELRIAREIQMSLLPQGPPDMPGVALAGYCEPAREVGGDYYDFLPIDDRRLGILIADVAGKGTSAALYMAELKGIVLSLSQVHHSPRQLLIDANRIISRHLDNRSFITMTYAVVDLEARTLTHARAGHCPLIYLPGPDAPSRAAQILTPDGLVVGLRIDDGELFDRLLVETTQPIGPGDLFVLYTDGVSEAMNTAGDLFGEARLSEVVQAHAATPFGELRDRILDEVHAFAGSTPQQDDLTLVLVKVDDAWTR